MIELPLRNRRGEVVALALIDDEDSALAGLRWHRDSDGYVRRQVRVAGVQHAEYLARRLLGLERGNPLKADHINGDKLDNRRCNLRAVTHAENHQNRQANRGGTSLYRGVSWDQAQGKWKAQAMLDGRQVYIGSFATEQGAAIAARAWYLDNMPFADRTASEQIKEAK